MLSDVLPQIIHKQLLEFMAREMLEASLIDRPTRPALRRDAGQPNAALPTDSSRERAFLMPAGIDFTNAHSDPWRSCDEDEASCVTWAGGSDGVCAGRVRKRNELRIFVQRKRRHGIRNIPGGIPEHKLCNAARL